MNDEQLRIEEKKKYIHMLIKNASVTESEENIDHALEKLNQLLKSFNVDSNA